MEWNTAAEVLANMGWFTWFGRWQERDRALERLGTLRTAYGDLGGKVIRLSSRTDLARRSAGSTANAFAYIERLFASMTGEYAAIGEQISATEAALRQGRVGDLSSAEALCKALEPKLAELDGHLTRWESQWQRIPQAIEASRQVLQQLRAQADEAVRMAGLPLPIADRITSTEQFLSRAEDVLRSGNPQEALRQVEDLHIAIDRLTNEVGQYMSAVRALAEAATPAEAAQSEPLHDLLAQLRRALTEGNLERFSAGLRSLQQRRLDDEHSA